MLILPTRHDDHHGSEWLSESLPVTLVWLAETHVDDPSDVDALSELTGLPVADVTAAVERLTR